MKHNLEKSQCTAFERPVLDFARGFALVVMAVLAFGLLGCAKQGSAASECDAPPDITRYEYDDAGNCVLEETALESDGQVILRVEREFTSAGLLSSETSFEAGYSDPYSFRDEYAYEDGVLIGRDSYNNYTGKIVCRHYAYEYDGDVASGNYSKREIPEDEEVLGSIENYSDGLLVSTSKCLTDKDGKFVEQPFSQSTYDAQGRKTSTIRVDTGYEERYEYDRDGNLVTTVSCDPKKMGAAAEYVLTECEYDELGQKTLETGYYPDGRVWFFRTFQYDEQGRLVEMGENCEV